MSARINGACRALAERNHVENGKTIEGKYANYFQLGRNEMEFIIEFGQLYSDETVPLLHTRVITSPPYAKALLELLQEAIAEHEAEYGPVREG
jgi:hypothetical protein